MRNITTRQLRRVHPWRWESVTAEADASVATELGKLKGAAVKSNKPIFPWRHSDEFLPRSSKHNVVIPSYAERIVAATFLGQHFPGVFFSDAWKIELADAAACAFGQAVAGIVSNVYNLAIDDVTASDGVDFQFPPAESGELSIAPANNAEESRVADMVSPELRKLYSSAHEHGRDQLEILLRTNPVQSSMYSLFCIPFIDRDDPAADQLLHEMKKIRDSPVGSDSMRDFYDLMEEYIDKNQGRLTTTIDLQVLVACEEVFRVRDRESGVLIQGHEDGKSRTVLHLARFETNVETVGDPDSIFPLHSSPQWILTDIDDLLGEEKWYHKKVT